MKYVYPAIFSKEKDGYAIEFPDIEGCYSCGEDLQDGIMMAEDALALKLYEYEKENLSIPAPSDRSAFKVKENEFVNYIACDTIEYQKRNNNKAVKKTLTIPEWLNEAAMARNINFSAILQEALKSKLGIID